MNFMRGGVLTIFGLIALYESWQLYALHHAGQRALLALLLGVCAIVLGIWRLTRGSGRARS